MAEDDSPQKGEYQYEEVLEVLGTGKFAVFLAIVAGLASMADSLEILSLSMIMPSATCDLHLTNFIKGVINASVFIGMLIGGMFWGSMADLTGRRRALLTSLTINWSCALVSSFLSDYPEFFVFRLLSGLGIGGSIPVIFSYYTEFQHKSRRGTMLSLLTFFWMTGNFIEAALAWSIIPNNIGFLTPWIDYRGWRFFTAVCAIPSFLATVCFIFMPESPKYLLQFGKSEEAVDILRKIYKFDKGKDLFEIKKLHLGKGENDSLVPKEEEKKTGNCCSRCFEVPGKMLKTISILFERNYRCTTIMLSIVFGSFSFGYYGMFMWFPELFVKLESGHGSTCGGSLITNSTLSTVKNVSLTEEMHCEGPSNFIYLQTFVIMGASSLSALVPVFLVDRIGRNVFLGVVLFLCGVSIFFFWMAYTVTEIFIIASVFAMLATIVWCILDLVAIEIYPTKVRSTAFGFMCVFIRLFSIMANLSFGALIDKECAVVILLCSGFMFVAGLATIMLPDMNQKEID